MNSHGQLIAVVGPSGAGKDSVIEGVLAAIRKITQVERTITRAAEPSGESYHSVSEAEFKSQLECGEFCLHWQAHGLYYGIPQSLLVAVERGETCIANLSRSVLIQATRIFRHVVVIHITATPQTLAQRLSRRGRESEEDIAVRLARSTYPLPDGLNLYHISNDEKLQDAIDQTVLVINRASMSIDRAGDESVQ